MLSEQVLLLKSACGFRAKPQMKTMRGVRQNARERAKQNKKLPANQRSSL